MSQRRQLVLILLVALAVRLAWGWHLPADSASLNRLPDQREYFDLARNILHGHGLAFFDSRFEQTVYAYRTPGYPLFVAACGANVRVVRAMQALVDTSTVLATYLIARRLRVPIPSLAAGIVALNPFLIYFTGLVLSESLFSCVLTWSMLAAASALPPPHRPSVELDVSAPSKLSALWRAGCLLAVAALIRPSVLLLGVLLAGWVANTRPRGTYRSMLLGLLVVAVPSVALFAPWAYRNHLQLGNWVWTTTNGGITSYDGFNPSATGASDQSFVTRMPQLRKQNEVQRSEYLGSLAVTFVRQHPGRVLKLAIYKIGRTWSPVPLSSDFSGKMYWTVALLYSLPFDLLVIAGLFSVSQPWQTKVFLLIPAIYFTAVHAASVGSLRYRVPVEPVLAVLAATGLIQLMSAVGGRTYGQADLHT